MRIRPFSVIEREELREAWKGSVGFSGRPNMRLKKLSERDIQKQILDFLVVHKIFHYRQNTGANTSFYKGKQRFFRFGAKGAPDIIAVISGQYIGIEVKAQGGKQTPDQAAFETSLTVAGGKYILAHSLDDVIEAVDGFL